MKMLSEIRTEGEKIGKVKWSGEEKKEMEKAERGNMKIKRRQK